MMGEREAMDTRFVNQEGEGDVKEREGGGSGR